MKSIQKLCAAGLLIAIGLLIPLFSPIRIRLDPASFTLASHVAIFIAMFLSPGIAVAVAVGTTLGFLLSTTFVIAMRAATHVIFALAGSFYLQAHPGLLEKPAQSRIFSLWIGLLHAAAEVLVVVPFYFGGTLDTAKGFFMTVVVLVGVGSVVHSMVDFEIALLLNRVLLKQRDYLALQQPRQAA